jgi:hypothetical protein
MYLELSWESKAKVVTLSIVSSCERKKETPTSSSASQHHDQACPCTAETPDAHFLLMIIV